MECTEARVDMRIPDPAGAASVVTKDVPDYAVVVGNPAKIVKMLDKNKF